MGNQSDIPEAEIDIREYINVLIRRKKLILAVFFISLAVSAGGSFLKPPVYEVTATVQLGSVNGFIISKEEAVAIVFNKHSLLSIIKEFDLAMNVESLSKSIAINDVAGTNFLTITITDGGPDHLFKINNAIIEPLINQGQDAYQKKIVIMNERLKELDAEIKNAETDIEETRGLIAGFSVSANSSLPDVSLRVILLKNNLPSYENNLSSLRDQRNALKIILNNAKDFKVFDQPTISKKSLILRLKKNIMVAGALSLMCGVLLAFFMEFWQKGKKGVGK